MALVIEQRGRGKLKNTIIILKMHKNPNSVKQKVHEDLIT